MGDNVNAGNMDVDNANLLEKMAFMTSITRHLSCCMTVERPSLIPMSRK